MGGEWRGARGGGKNDQRTKRFRVHPSLDTLKRHRGDVYDSLRVSAKRQRGPSWRQLLEAPGRYLWGTR